MSLHRDSRPPRAWAFLARVLIRGEQGRFIRADLADSFARDQERGHTRRSAGRRYAMNVVASTTSVWKGGLTRLVTRGVALDVKLGIRMLGKQPLLTGVAMLALGLGIPAALSLHHALGVFLSPPPGAGRRAGHGDSQLESRYPSPGARIGARACCVARDTHLVPIDRCGPLLHGNVHLGDPGAPPVRGAQMSSSTFDLLRVAPVMGRGYGPADEVRGAPNVVIISEDLWTSRFVGDPEIVGKTVSIGRNEHTVGGVMPGGFRFPFDDDLWLPLRARAVDYAIGEGPRLYVFGRLADGATKQAADLEVQLLTERLASDHPEVYDRFVGEVVDMPILFSGEGDIKQSAPEILLFQSIMFVFLLIVCGNVGTLMLARAAMRTGEISIRTALGASRARIIAQLFIEALVLAVVATGAGLLLAEATARWLMNLIGPFESLPYWMDFTLRADTIILAFALAVLSAVVAGVLPAFKATQRGVHANLQRAAAGGSTIRFGFGSTLLIVGEVVLSVGFLAMGGALVRSAFVDTENLLGFEPQRFLRASVDVPWVDPAEHPEFASEGELSFRLTQTQQEILRRVADDSDVRAVAMGLTLPGAMLPRDRVLLESGIEQGDVVLPYVGGARVDVGFFSGLDRPILAGRDFTAVDVADLLEHRPSVIVNTTFVEQVLGGRNAIGQRFRLAAGGDPELEQYDWFEIVGVVGRFGTNPINPIRDAAIYYPMAPGESDRVRYMVELGGDVGAFASRFREIVASVDPEWTVREAVAVSEVMEAQGGLYRWVFGMQVVLAGIAFLLSITGLYALMSFTVSQRTREIGIRTALGAHVWGIVSTIARRAVIQLSVGLALGAVWAWILLRGIANDAIVIPINLPVTISLTTVVAALVGVIACASPMLRGLRIQPTEALREF